MRREGGMPVAARQRPACMDAGGRAVSGTKAEESRERGRDVRQTVVSPGPLANTSVVIPALREWLVYTTGFLGRLFPTCLLQAGAALPPTSL